jgi:23S rRNA (uridine2552-2'-O)-methyltransferase
MSSNIRSKHIRVKTAKGRKKSSTTWLKRQLNDPFVLKARTEGYRSRAAFKLIEINQKFQLLKPNMKILDLGAAPGGWSQIAAKLISSNKDRPNIVAVDLLEIEPLPGVITMVKDFLEPDAKDLIIEALGEKVDIVMSDMAANTTGHTKTDHIRIMELCEKAVQFSYEILKPGGHFIAKIFKGGTEVELLTEIKQKFSVVKHFKPKSSRKESSEEYLVAMNFKTPELFSQ